MDFMLDINMMRVMLPVCPDSAQKQQSPDVLTLCHVRTPLKQFTKTFISSQLLLVLVSVFSMCSL